MTVRHGPSTAPLAIEVSGRHYEGYFLLMQHHSSPYPVDNAFSISQRENTEPDFDDEDWMSKVTDWGEFWEHQKWEEDGDNLEDDVDV